MVEDGLVVDGVVVGLLIGGVMLSAVVVVAVVRDGVAEAAESWRGWALLEPMLKGLGVLLLLVF